MLFYVNSPFYFQQEGLKITFPSTKFGFFNVALGLCIFSNLSQFMKETENWKFEILSNSLKSLKVTIFEVPLSSYFVRWRELSLQKTCV